MSIQAAYVVPHPPLIIPSVGRGEERGIQKTIDAYKEIARRVVTHRPEAIIVSSPHAPLYRDGFHITTDTLLSGSMESFRAPQTKIEVDIDVALTQSIIQEATRSALDIVPSSWRDHEMDHATFIPLHFIEQSYKEAGVVPNFRVVRVGLSGLSADVHRQFGHVLSSAVDATKRRCIYIASGDLSHKLKTDGPYGFAPEGPKLDHRLCELFQSGALEDLFELDEDFCDRAAECGVRSFQIMAGVLEMQSSETFASHSLQSSSFGLYSAELLSYEGPFGVGYAVAAFEKHNSSSCSIDPYVALARASVESFVRDGKPLLLADYLKEHHLNKRLSHELLETRAGVFVSLHEQGQLRGCIGTIMSTTDCIAEEIIQNAISACSRDPRFPAVKECELDLLDISVDVLSEAEPITSEEELDPQRYGVIVTKGFRRGLLLPNLEGVDTVTQQVSIAKQKAGIHADEHDVELERFEVVRHV